MDCKRVFVRKCIEAPNVDDAWVDFCHKNVMDSTKNRKRNVLALLGGLIAAAAILTVGFFLPIKHSIQVVPQRIFCAVGNVNKHVTLSTKINTLILSGKTADSLVYSQAQIAAIPQDLKLVTPRGKDYHIILPDGTKVWLNADTKLIFPDHFSGTYRLVQLEGEAYFEVAKDKKHPFIVRCQAFTTEVLGTKFDVRAYSSTDANVVLVEGSVALRSNKSKNTCSIIPGQKAQIKGSGDFIVEHVDTYAYVQWKDGYFYFEDVMLGDILQELGRWYNVNIIVENPQKVRTRMHFAADRNESLSVALDNLNTICDVHATLNNGEVVVR